MTDLIRIRFTTGMACLALAVSCGSPAEEKNTGKNTAPAVVPAAENTANAPATAVMLPAGKYYFSGLIDHKYSIHLLLEVNGGTGSGKYYYNSQKRELGLSGTIDNGRIELDEKVKEKITGHFTGQLYGADSATGHWRSPRGNELVFVLYASDSSTYNRQLGEEPVKRFDAAQLKAFMQKFRPVQLPFDDEAMDEEQAEGLAFTPEEIRTFAYPEYNEENDWVYQYYYGKRFEMPNYTALVYTENYNPGAFGVHNLSLVMITIGKNGELIDRAYLGCHCMDTNMGSNDYYATDDVFTFSKGSILVKSVHTHATLIENEGEEAPFNEQEQKTRTIQVGADGKIGATGF